MTKTFIPSNDETGALPLSAELALLP